MDKMISQWRQRISQLSKIRGRLEHQLMRPKSNEGGFRGEAMDALLRLAPVIEIPQKKDLRIIIFLIKKRGEPATKKDRKGNESSSRARNDQVSAGMAHGKIHRR